MKHDGLTIWNSRNLDWDGGEPGAKANKDDVGNSLVVTPHPLVLNDQAIYHRALLLPGEYLDSFLARHGVLPGQQWVVSLGGVDLQEIHWRRIRPRHGFLIEARRVPEGQILKIAAVVALSYFTFGAGGLGAGGLFASGGLIGGGMLAAGVAYLGGSLLINKLLGPKPVAAKQAPALANNTNSPTYSLQAGKNRSRQFETMALVLGQPYCIPDLGAQPYSYFANGEQNLWQMFHFGLNCADVTSMRIGQTDLAYYIGIGLLREGFASGNTGLFATTTNVDSIAGALLEAPASYGPYVTRTSSHDTILLAVDLDYSLFAVEKEDGSYITSYVTISMEYRLTGTVDWLPFLVAGADAGSGGLNMTQGNASTKPLRLTFSRTVAAGQYDVRLRKLTKDLSSGTESNAVQWSTLKSFQLDTGDYRGQARLAMSAQATGQLNGAIDEFNAIATQNAMPYWNGAAWVTATTPANGLSNPGALILLLARGIYDQDDRLLAGLGLPDDEIDIESLQGFMVYCAAHDFQFNLFLQENTSIGDLIDSIAAAGLGARSEHTGKFGVIWFSGEQPVEAVLNMATMKPKSFVVEYNTQETADEIELQYFDQARGYTWKSVRVAAPGVTVPTRTARQQVQGVNREAHAAVVARFGMAQNIFQRKTVTCEVDLEHMNFRRGTVMALSHDLTQWGYGGRLKAVVNNAGLLTLTLDDVIPAVSPLGAITRYMGFRVPGSSSYLVLPVAAFVGNSRTVTLAGAWPGGVPVPGDTADNPAHDTIWIYDFKPTPGLKLRVSDIVPKGNLDGATVSLVPEGPEFWDYVWNGTYTPPPSNSLLSQGPPVVTGAVVTEQLGRQGNTFYVELTMTFDVTGRFDRAELWGAVGGGALQLLGTTRSQAVSWRGGVAETWTLELRTFGSTRVGTPYPFVYAVVGLAFNPEKPEDLALTQESVFCKPTQFAVDVVGFVIRSSPGAFEATMADFLRGSKCHEGLVSDFPWKFTTRLYGVQTVMAVSEDSTGNWSEVASASLDFGQPATDNIGQTFDFRAAGWPADPRITALLAPGHYPQYGATDIDSFARATPATYYDADGVLQTAAVDVPRFDHDPVTLAPLGLLIEAAKTVLYPHYLKFDGTDDGMGTAAFAAGTLNGNMDAFFVVRRGSAGTATLGYESGAAKFFASMESGSAVVAHSNAGTPTYLVNGVAVPGGAATTRGQLHTALSVGPFSVLEIRNLDLSAWTDFFTGGLAGYRLNGAIAAALVVNAQSNAVRAEIVDYFYNLLNKYKAIYGTDYTGSDAVITARFSGGQPGLWVKPADLTALFQNSVGSTPVTAVEQPVGKVIDQSGRGNHLLQPTSGSRPVVSARMNLLTKTDQFNDAAWGKTSGGTGLNPVVYPNDAIAPDGFSTADRVVFDKGAGATSTDQSSIVNTVVATIAGQPTVAFIGLKSATASSYLMRLDFGSGAGSNGGASYPSLITVTPTWKIFEIRLSSAADAVRRMTLRLRGGQGTDNYADVHVWGGYQENAAVPSGDYQSVNTATDYQTVLSYRAPDICDIITDHGGRVNCEVDGGGDLVANPDPATDLNVLADLNGEPDLNVTQLLPMVYETVFTPLYGGGTLVLDVETEGPQSALEYRINGSTTNDLNVLADLNLEADLNGPSNGLQPWPGALLLQRGLSYTLRISIAGGTLPPKLKKLIANLALQRVTQTFTAMAIAAGGTRLNPAAGTPAVTWVEVQSVTMLPEVDGSGAVGGRFIDLSAALGPLVQQVNSAGVAVASRSLPTVGGLIDA